MILYLGLDPSGWKTDKPLIHYPVIQVRPLPVSKPSDWEEITHLIFTSKTAVRHWQFFESKQALAIGEATADFLAKSGVSSIQAPEATQEGMIKLLENLPLKNAYLLWPRSTKARSVLSDYLTSRAIRFQIIDLYETHFQKPEVPISLEEVEEIVFTSPSTVEGFLRIFKTLPTNKKLTAIGPVTACALGAV